LKNRKNSQIFHTKINNFQFLGSKNNKSFPKKEINNLKISAYNYNILFCGFGSSDFSFAYDGLYIYSTRL
jgi:hypothetical protein